MSDAQAWTYVRINDRGVTLARILISFLGIRSGDVVDEHCASNTILVPSMVVAAAAIRASAALAASTLSGASQAYLEALACAHRRFRSFSAIVAFSQFGRPSFAIRWHLSRQTVQRGSGVGTLVAAQLLAGFRLSVGLLSKVEARGFLVMGSVCGVLVGVIDDDLTSVDDSD